MDSDISNDEDGWCVGETFTCDCCKIKKTIVRDEYPGDRNDCKVCDMPLCLDCCTQCSYCMDSDICKTCGAHCNSCDVFVCNNCIEEDSKKCSECKKILCDDCNKKDCKCLKTKK